MHLQTNRSLPLTLLALLVLLIAATPVVSAQDESPAPSQRTTPADECVEPEASAEPVTDSAPVVHRQHDVASARQLLIESVVEVVVVHVVPTEKHLSS